MSGKSVSKRISPALKRMGYDGLTDDDIFSDLDGAVPYVLELLDQQRCSLDVGSKYFESRRDLKGSS